MSGVALALGACGVAGVVYGLIVVTRARGQTNYRPVLEDWLWHSVFPLIAYTLLVAASVGLIRYPRQALFVVGATSLLLLFIGIHNAWDTVTYVAVEQAQTPQEREDGNERQ